MFLVFMSAAVSGGAILARGSDTPLRSQEAAVGPVDQQDFVGSEACGTCHASVYDAWASSTHGQAGGAPSPERLLAAFDGTPIRFRDALVTPTVTREGDYVFTVERSGRPTTVFRVDGVVGGGHMFGGGTQGFVSRFPDGTVRFLPFDFAAQQGVWFCNTADILGWWATDAVHTERRLQQGWVPIREDMELADCGDWPPMRTLGTSTRFQNCQQCHGSQITLRFDPSALRYVTEIRSLDINCESCHGPGRRHVALAQAGSMASTEDIGMTALSTLDKDASLRVCFQCHAVKQPLEPGYLPGRELEDHFSLKLAIVNDEPFFPDGRVRTFAYQMNHLYSACYVDGSMTCVDCHDPHSQGYRDIWGARLVGRFDDGQCLDCHPSKAEDPEAHTRHAPTSAGARCVACHMPYLQQPSVGTAVRYTRSDHTIAIPRPGEEDAWGIQGACQSCHPDRTPAFLTQQTRAWYGALRPRPQLVAGVLGAGSFTSRTDAAEALLRPNESHPIAQVTALNLFMRKYLDPDMEELEAEVVAALTALTASPDLDLRALALTALHVARGRDPETRAVLQGHLDGLGTREAALQRRWVAGLRLLGDARVRLGELAEAVSIYMKALEVVPEHPGALSDLALAFTYLQDYETALDYYARSLAQDADQPEVWVNRGVALENLGRASEAIDSYREAVTRNPGEALAHFNLGNVSFVRGDYEAAVDEYRRAVIHNPSLSDAHLMLAQSYILLGELDSALVSVRNTLEFDPENDPARRMLADLLPPEG